MNKQYTFAINTNDQHLQVTEIIIGIETWYVTGNLETNSE